MEDSRMIVTMTVGDLRELIKEEMSAIKKEDEPTTGRLIYGLRGISELFHVSHKTAQKYKDTFLKPAVKQNGRKIVTNADYALKLFNDYKHR